MLNQPLSPRPQRSLRYPATLPHSLSHAQDEHAKSQITRAAHTLPRSGQITSSEYRSLTADDACTMRPSGIATARVHRHKIDRGVATRGGLQRISAEHIRTIVSARS